MYCSKRGNGISGEVMTRKLNLFLKRSFDMIASGMGIILLSPFFVIVSVLIKVVMPGPVLFKQVRVGKHKRLFKILKFRTMRVDKTAENSHDVSKDAERLTTLGKFLRRTKIDELPQLVNVFIGDMSLVGPRPTFEEQVRQYSKRQMKRLDMRPGMTGLAQINGNTALSWDERIRFDIRYVERFSVGLDIRILLKTLVVVVVGEESFIINKYGKD